MIEPSKSYPTQVKEWTENNNYNDTTNNRSLGSRVHGVYPPC